MRRFLIISILFLAACGSDYIQPEKVTWTPWEEGVGSILVHRSSGRPVTGIVKHQQDWDGSGVLVTYENGREVFRQRFIRDGEFIEEEARNDASRFSSKTVTDRRGQIISEHSWGMTLKDRSAAAKFDTLPIEKRDEIINDMSESDLTGMSLARHFYRGGGLMLEIFSRGGWDNETQIVTHTLFNRDGTVKLVNKISGRQWFGIHNYNGCFNADGGAAFFDADGNPANGEFIVPDIFDNNRPHFELSVANGKLTRLAEHRYRDSMSRSSWESHTVVYFGEPCRATHTIRRDTDEIWGALMSETFAFPGDKFMFLSGNRRGEILIRCGQGRDRIGNVGNENVRTFNAEESRRMLEGFDRDNPRNLCD